MTSAPRKTETPAFGRGSVWVLLSGGAYLFSGGFYQLLPVRSRFTNSPRSLCSTEQVFAQVEKNKSSITNCNKQVLAGNAA